MCIVAVVEQLHLKCGAVGNLPIYDNAVFSWAKKIETQWRMIRAELDGVLQRKDELPGFHEISSDVATISTDRREGEAFIFDDAYEHEAWNNTVATRVVLFVDLVKPTRQPARFLNWLLLHLALFTPFIRDGMRNQKAWEKRFYAEAEALRIR